MKKFLPIIITAIVVAGVSFYGGTLYAKRPSFIGEGAGRGNLQALSSEERAARMQQFGAGGIARGGARVGGAQGGAMIAGKILQNDGTTMTVQLRDGGSRIILLSKDVAVTKTTVGSAGDLVKGTEVLVGGEEQGDKSVVAKTVQILPLIP